MGQIGELNGTYAKLFKLQMLLVPPLLVAMLGTIGYAAKKIMDVDGRLTAVESSRFSSADGLSIWKEIAQIREKMAALPNEWPPKWFQERVTTLEANQREMADRIQRNNSLLVQLTSKIEALERISTSDRQDRRDRSETPSTNRPG